MHEVILAAGVTKYFGPERGKYYSDEKGDPLTMAEAGVNNTQLYCAI